MPVVYCTATNSTTYCVYDPELLKQPRAARNVVKDSVTIIGGANNAKQKGYLVTPKGVATVVTKKQLELLLQNKSFLRHQKAGFVLVEKDTDLPKDPDVVAAGMNKKDKSAPITPDSPDVAGNADLAKKNIEVKVPPAPADRKA